MPLTDFQRDICRLIARNRVASGESYVAGAAALNELTGGPRLSRDLDLFHDTEEALQATWDLDCELLRSAGFGVEIVRERPSFVEASVSRGEEKVLLEWARDSAFRFFPLMEHLDFGLTLHPFDLATNKVLALVGRLEVRDWIDVIHCDEQVQPLGCLAWAASGKDPGFSPAGIIDHAARAHYCAEEIRGASFQGPPPDPAELARRWREIVAAGSELVAVLPVEMAGRCVLTASGKLFRGSPKSLAEEAETGRLLFHEGRIRGALPRVLRRPTAQNRH